MIPSINGDKKLLSGKLKFPGYFRLECLCPAWLPMAEVFEERLRKISRQESFSYTDDLCVSVLRLKEKRALSGGAYHLKISGAEIDMEAGDGEGISNGLTTLYWMIRESAGKNEIILPCADIQDAPKYTYRGFLVDDSRHFFGAEAVKTLIEQASLRKLNRMHWHLSDDQGYRIESRKFPELNRVGSYRDDMVFGSGYGGYYTFEEIRDIVDYAKARGVEIIPELDVPGHTTSIIRAYPQLTCRSDVPVDNPAVAGIFSRIMCAGKDETLDFLRELLAEIVPLFPYPYFHVGGDEAPKSEWKECPLCQRRMREQGLHSEEELQVWFTDKIKTYLEEQGKQVICWNDIVRGGALPEGAIVQYWAEEGDYAPDAFDDVERYIYSDARQFYLDYIPALCPLRTVRCGDGRLGNDMKIPEGKILGFEGALWAEQILDAGRQQQMAFPRLFAVAERGWCGDISVSGPDLSFRDRISAASASPDYIEFRRRVEEEEKWLTEDGISFFPVDEADPEKDSQKAAVIADWKPKAVMVKQMELAGGSLPGAPMTAPQLKGIISRLVHQRCANYFTDEETEDIIQTIFE